MDTKKELDSVFDEYGDTIQVSDFGIKPSDKNVVITHIHRKEEGEVQYWSGDLDTDTHAEHIILTDDEKEQVNQEIIDLL